MSAHPHSIENIRQHLHPANQGMQIIYEKSLPSTNDLAHQLMEGNAESAFLAVLTERQEQGRGRHGRVWHAPEGAGIALSVAVKFADAEAFPYTEWPLLSALAVRSALATATGIPLAIKWPNDIQANGKKVCGILTELGHSAKARFLVTGIGVNVNTSLDQLPYELQDQATSLRLAGRRTEPLPRDKIVAELLNEMYATFQDCLAGMRFRDRRSEYVKHCATLGRQVRTRQGTDIIEGVADAIDDQGTLYIVTNQGARKAVISGEIVQTAPSPGTSLQEDIAT